MLCLPKYLRGEAVRGYSPSATQCIGGLDFREYIYVSVALFDPPMCLRSDIFSLEQRVNIHVRNLTMWWGIAWVGKRKIQFCKVVSFFPCKTYVPHFWAQLCNIVFFETHPTNSGVHTHSAVCKTSSCHAGDREHGPCVNSALLQLSSVPASPFIWSLAFKKM